jgi:hypothetical protein
VVILKFQVFWDVVLCQWASNSGILKVSSAFIFMVKQFKKHDSEGEGTVVLQGIGN